MGKLFLPGITALALLVFISSKVYADDKIQLDENMTGGEIIQGDIKVTGQVDECYGSTITQVYIFSAPQMAQHFESKLYKVDASRKFTILLHKPNLASGWYYLNICGHGKNGCGSMRFQLTSPKTDVGDVGDCDR